MARNPAAVWDPLPSSSGGAFTGGPKKGVAHKVQGATYAGARGTYLSRSLGPHFTIGEDGVLYQHLDTNEASSAVANDSGGVQTNRDGAIQVEVVGFSGVSSTPAQLATFVDLQVWLHANEDIPPIWPAGRPPQTAEDGYGKSNGYRHPGLWESTAGWYGHSQVPENTHWDPAWTDEEWAAITQPPLPAPPPEEDDMMLQLLHTVDGTPEENAQVFAYGPGYFAYIGDSETLDTGHIVGLWDSDESVQRKVKGVNKRQRDVVRTICLSSEPSRADLELLLATLTAEELADLLPDAVKRALREGTG